MSEETKTEKPAPKKIIVATEMPRMGTAHLVEKFSLPGKAPQSSYSGEVAFDAAGVPAGVRVRLGEHHANVEYEFIPAVRCTRITVKK